MIVKPKKKRSFPDNELRVISIGSQAIEEILWETLMEHQEEYFDIDAVDDSLICFMRWNRQQEMLTYAVMPIRFALEGKQLDFEYICRKTGITSDSLFQPRRYRKMKITPACFLRGMGE